MSKSVRVHVMLPKTLIEQVDQLVGPRGRSKFITEAVRAKLDRDRRQTEFDEKMAALKDDPAARRAALLAELPWTRETTP